MNCKSHLGTEAIGTCVYCGNFFCKDCLVEVGGKNYCKVDVTNAFNEAKQQTSSPQINISNVNTANANVNTSMPIVVKKKWTTFLLCLFLGWLGIHRFYTGKNLTGLLYLFSWGLFGFGVIFDLIMILIGSYRDKTGYPLQA